MIKFDEKHYINYLHKFILTLIFGLIFSIPKISAAQNQHNIYPWLEHCDEKNALVNRIEVPEGYERVSVTVGSFADWLRNLPLKEGNPPVYLYDGKKKYYQEGHYAVMDIDIGSRDLQQCADAIIRLYAEYLYSKKKFDKIKFKITNRNIIKFNRWILGSRPLVRLKDNQIIWHYMESPDSSYKTFRKYLDFVFMYAGTHSLSEQLQSVENIKGMEIGDIFIQGGFPGHAVLVIDMAVNKKSEEKIFLLCQSYMPAQDIHILKNLNDSTLNPWYRLDFSDTLYIPEWNFTAKDLKKF